MKTIITILLFFFTFSLNATQYFVSNAGFDTNNGTSQATPIQTLTKVNSLALVPGDIVSFRCGDTFVGSLVVSHNGSSGIPITYNSYVASGGPTTKPIITGLVTVSTWTSIGGNIWQSNTNVSGLSTLNMVLVNGAFAPIGKWPDGVNNYANISSGTVSNTSPFAATMNASGVPANIPGGVVGGQVVVRKNHWIIDKATILTQTGNTLTFNSPNNYQFCQGQATCCAGTNCWGFFVQNSRVVCTAQNEWWYDAANHRIEMFSTATPSNVQIATVDILVNIGGSSFINFTGLEFKGSNSATVSSSSGNNIVFSNCAFNFAGINGFTIQAASHHFTLANSTAERTNNNFISGGGSANWLITNNTIHNTAQTAGMGNSSDGNYIGIYNVNNSVIQYNSIVATGYSGIDFRGPGSTVRRNIVDTFCNTKDDGAGIYTFTGTGTTVYSPPRIVDSNIVGNGGGANRGTSTANWDASGIYMDDNSSEVTITNNTIYNNGSGGLFLHADHALTIRNNTIYNNVLTGGYGNLLEIYPGAVTTAAVRNLIFQNNKVIARAANQLVAYLATNESNMSQWSIPASNWDLNYLCRPLNDATTNYIQLVKQSGNQLTNLAGWQASSGLDLNSRRSPINVAAVTDIRFEVNKTSSTANISLSGNSYIDVTGAAYSGTLVLAPYSSWVGLRTGISNALPTVNAGVDKVVTLPTNSTSVTGTASDADGTITSTTWTKISGPAGGTISSPNALTTNITALVQGVYIFQLSATDNQGGTAVDQMQITVNPAPNQSPAANAGVDRTIQLPVNTVTQTGSGTDPDGTIVAYLWTQVSGPSAATIVSASSATSAFNNLIPGVYVFNLRVTDNGGLTANDQFQVTVNPAPNTAPTANAGPNQTITLPTNSVTLTGSGTDPDGTIASYAWTKISGPATFNIVSPSSATTLVNNLVAGTYVFQLTVTDNLGATGSSTVQVVVNAAPPPNQPPVANAGTDKNITLPTNSISQVGSGTDADGTVTGYLWTKISGPATFTIVSPNSSTTTISNLVAGTYVFQLQVTDNQGATGTDQMTVIVNPAPNIPPTVNAGPDQSLTLPTTSSTFAGSASDADGTITLISWTFISGPGPTPIIGNSSSLTSGVSNMTVAGSYTFQLSVTDNSGATRTDQMIIVVNPAPNQLPIANAGTDKNITLPTNSVTQVGSGTDPDGTIVSYLWTKISGPASFNIVSATQATTVINNLVQGTYVFNLRVTDNSGANANDQVTIVVNPAVNQPPTANAGTNQTITLPTNSVTLVGSGSDPDGTITGYLWTKISGPATFTIVSPTSATTAVNNLVAGTYVFQLQVTDNQGATATNTVQIIVNPAPNQAPTANAGTNQTITLPTNSVTLNGSGTDPDGTITGYLWTKISGPATFTIVSPTSASTVVNNLVAGVYIFQLQVTDNNGATATNTVQVIVNAAPPPNQPPVADAGTDKNITLPTNSINQVGSGTDADGTVVSYAWTKISGPATFTIVSQSSATTVINNLVAGTYVFRLTVTDNQGATDTDDMTVIVNPQPNQPPIANAGTDKNITLPTNSVTQVGSGTDADGTIASYSWTKISGPATFNIVSPTSSTTIISNLVAGTYVFRLTVTDNIGASATDDVTIIVNPAPNVPPTANAGADQTITLPSTQSTFAGTATDPDGSITATTWAFLAGPGPTPVIANPSSLTSTVSNMTVAGSYSFRLSVVDNNGATDRDTMIILVKTPPNQPPLSNAGADQIDSMPLVNGEITLVGSGSDADGSIVGILWSLVSGPSGSVIISPTQLTTQVRIINPGVYVFRLAITDNTGTTVNDDVTINVIAATTPQPTGPIANAGPDQKVVIPFFSGSTGAVATGSGIPGNYPIVGYLWTKIAGPASGTIMSPNTAQTTLRNLSRGTYIFQLTVTDSFGQTATDQVTIDVRKQWITIRHGKIIIVDL